MSNLMLVDDREIRKKAFSRVGRLLSKLQRMEANLESYFSRDQRLFTEWVDLTFRHRRQRIDELRAEYRDLVDFHNWMHALAEMEDIGLPEAAVRVAEEIRLYREGRPEERRRIEILREAREDFVRARLEQDHQRAERRRRTGSEDEDLGAARTPNIDAADIEELEHFRALSDAEIAEWCADAEVAHLFLGKILRIASINGDYQLFLRVWDLLHPKVQRDFSRQFDKQAGISLFEVVQQLRAKTGSRSNARDEEDFAAREKPPASPTETLKLLYRQLARKLHPDMNSSDQEIDWRKGMWLRVQAAYKAEDAKEITKLYHLVLLRGSEWQSLRISELQITHEWLADEISSTNDYLKDLRRMPAWGFSRRKNFDPIAKKIERDLNKEQKILEDQVQDLRAHHNFLERMGRRSRS